MATTFNLQDTINKTNNPSADGIFEYGWWDSTNTVFTRFPTYGYTDGSPTPPTGPYDSTKILGWYDPSLGEPDFAVVFENIAGNANITPQPFPSTGIYVHPSMNPDRRIGVRMNVPANGTLSATGTIQAASVGCGSDVGYNIRDGATQLIPRTNLPKSNSVTNISFSPTVVGAGDNIDFIVDIGNDATNFCDDTAIDITYTILLDKMPTPQLQGTFTCSTTTAIIYNLALQGEGTVEFYKVGTALPIATAPITQVGYNGRATFTGLDLSEGGEFYVIAKNAGQLDSDESTHVTIPSCYTADAVNDNVGTQTTGTAHTVDVSTNDTLCSFGTTTFALVAGSQVNVTGVSFTGSTATYTPTAAGAFSFQYNILCNGHVIDTATVSGTGCTPPAIGTQPTGGAICTGGNITLTVAATGTATLTYQWRNGGVNIIGATLASYNATAAGTYDVVVTNGCGSVTSNNAIVTLNTAPAVATGGTIPDATAGTAYNHSITYTGTTPLAIANIVKPTWMTVTLAGSTVTLTGTPTAGDVTASTTVSFDVSNTCATTPFSDTLAVLSGCTNVGGGTVSGPSPVVVGANNVYTVTGLTGTAPFNYTWSVGAGGTIVSGQGTTSVTISFTAGATVSLTVDNCSGAGTVTRTLPVVIFTADAVDDAVGTKTTGTSTTTDVTTNDTVCNLGTTTYALVAGTGTNVSALSMTAAGVATYTPTADGAFSFQYNILCNGNVIDTATVSGTASTPCVAVASGVINGNMNPVLGATETYTVTGLTGTAPFTYNWTIVDGIILSGQGTDTIQVQWI